VTVAETETYSAENSKQKNWRPRVDIVKSEPVKITAQRVFQFSEN
jgi:hypothetical protein